MSNEKKEQHEYISKVLTEAGLTQISLQFTDLAGALKSVDLPLQRLAHALEGRCWLDGSTLLGDIRSVEFDTYLQPDLASFRLFDLPEGKVARIFCRLRTATGEPLPTDPPTPLDRLTGQLEGLGYKLSLKAELSFYLLLDETLSSIDSKITVDAARAKPNQQRFARTLAGTLLPLEVVLGMPEKGAEAKSYARYTLTFPFSSPTALAQGIVTTRYLARAIADSLELTVTFMPRPLAQAPGSPLTLQWQLRQIKAQKGEEGETTARASESFLAGVVAHAPSLCALLAPTINSYRRLLPAGDGPFLAGWSAGPGAAFARKSKGFLGRSPDFIFTNAADASCNPFLGFAALVAAGLEGLEQNLTLATGLPATRDLPELASQPANLLIPLPTTLGEALDELAWDSPIRDALGYELYSAFSRIKEGEWRAWQANVTAWELEQYLEL